jgi:hypothetical protein
MVKFGKPSEYRYPCEPDNQDSRAQSKSRLFGAMYLCSHASPCTGMRALDLPQTCSIDVRIAMRKATHAIYHSFCMFVTKPPLCPPSHSI